MSSVALSSVTNGKRVLIASVTVYSYSSQDIGQSEDCVGLETFINTYMHLDYDAGGDIGSTGGTGLCVGYYDKEGETGAKYHFTQLSDVRKEIILKSESYYGTVGGHEYTYDEIKDRLSEWARINGESISSLSLSSAALMPGYFIKETNT